MMDTLLSSDRSTVEIAQDLLGCVLQKETNSGLVAGWIVDVEAYLGVEDLASHSYGGKRTPRTSRTIWPTRNHLHLSNERASITQYCNRRYTDTTRGNDSSYST